MLKQEQQHLQDSFNLTIYLRLVDDLERLFCLFVCFLFLYPPFCLTGPDPSFSFSFSISSNSLKASSNVLGFSVNPYLVQ